MSLGIMRRLGLVLLLAGIAAPAAAETDVPDGSYLNSCRQVQVRWGKDLAAFCATRSGQWVVSRLNDFNACIGDIANRDGELVCAEPTAPPPARAEIEPAGSYRKSCQRIGYRNGVLSAMCRDRDGDLEPTSLNLATCPSDGFDIANVDGQLRCGRAPVYGGAPGYVPGVEYAAPRPAAPPPPSPPPVGSYLNSCRNVTFNNGLLSADCNTFSGSTKRTVLATSGCPRTYDIANQYGELVCKNTFDSGGGWGNNWGSSPNHNNNWGNNSWGGGRPPGSYLATCRNVSVSAGFLNAECQNRSGKYERTTMGLSFCGGAKDIVNNDGRLSCPRW